MYGFAGVGRYMYFAKTELKAVIIKHVRGLAARVSKLPRFISRACLPTPKCLMAYVFGYHERRGKATIVPISLELKALQPPPAFPVIIQSSKKKEKEAVKKR